MKIIKGKLQGIVSILYILGNVLFYKSIFKDISNMYLTFVALILLGTEVAFWYLVLKDLMGGERLKLSDRDRNIVGYLFVFGTLIIGITRAILHGSPYFNDMVNTNIYMLSFVGISRVLAIFNAILFIFLSIDEKNIYYILMAVLNLIVSFMIWLDFDMDITSILRIIIAILYMINIRLYWKKNSQGKEEKNEILQ